MLINACRHQHELYSATLRRLVTQRAQEQCEYCRFPQTASLFAFEIEHIIAEKHDGITEAENLAVRETSLSYKVFPQECPYSCDQMLDSGFFPGQSSDFDEEWE